MEIISINSVVSDRMNTWPWSPLSPVSLSAFPQSAEYTQHSFSNRVWGEPPTQDVQYRTLGFRILPSFSALAVIGHYLSIEFSFLFTQLFLFISSSLPPFQSFLGGVLVVYLWVPLIVKTTRYRNIIPLRAMSLSIQ